MSDHKLPGELTRHVGRVEDWTSYLGEVVASDLDSANVVTSTVIPARGGLIALHAPVIDLDVPVTYVPSTTPGHGHLYVDVVMTAETMWNLLEAMVDAGLVEEGFLKASKARGYTSVRLPWVKKEPIIDPSPSKPGDPF